MKVSNDDTFTGKFNLCGITIVDFSRKVPVNGINIFGLNHSIEEI